MTSYNLDAPSHVLRRVDSDDGERHSTRGAKLIEYFTGNNEGLWITDLAEAKLFYAPDAADLAVSFDMGEGANGGLKYTVLMLKDA